MISRRRDTVSTQTGTEFFLGTTTPIEITLPAGAVPEIVVDIIVGFPEGACGLLPPTFGLLVDDLRLE